jgi:hypothetical protein
MAGEVSKITRQDTVACRGAIVKVYSHCRSETGIGLLRQRQVKILDVLCPWLRYATVTGIHDAKDVGGYRNPPEPPCFSGACRQVKEPDAAHGGSLARVRIRTIPDVLWHSQDFSAAGEPFPPLHDAYSG